MKKTLSVLLTLVMVLGCLSAMFTMPTSALELTPPVATTGEALPENLLANTSGTTLIVADGKTINAGEYYQLDVTVTTDDTANKFYPVFNTAANAAVTLNDIVGVRYQSATPGAVDTAYNYTAAAATSAGNAIANAAGAYTYTYIFSAAAGINNIVLPNEVTAANLFALKDTDWNNYLWEWDFDGYKRNYRVVRYMVQEGDNVFQRMYGYRAVGTNNLTVGSSSNLMVVAKAGGDYYDLYLKGGYNYYYGADMRIPVGAQNIAGGTDNAAVQFNLMETRPDNLDWTAEYNAFKAKNNFTDTYENYSCPSSWYDSANNQMYFNESANGYIYWYSQSNSATVSRRITLGAQRPGYTSGTKFFTHATVTFADGKVMANLGYSSGYFINEWYINSASTAFGKRLTKSTVYTDNWNSWHNITGTYLTNLVTGQDTVEKALKAARATGSNYANLARYQYDADADKYIENTSYSNFVVPATDNTYVALVMYNMGYGHTYDFEPLSFTSDEVISGPEVEYVDRNGNETTVPANDDTAYTEIKDVDVANNKITLALNGVEGRDAFTFKGWSVNGQIVSTDFTAEIDYSAYDPETTYPVVVYENYLSNVGGFESFAHNKSLALPNKVVTLTSDDGASTLDVTIHDGTPTGENFGFYQRANNTTTGAIYLLPAGFTYSDAQPYISENGAFAANGQNVVIHGAPVNNSGNTVTPYSGSKMARLNSATNYAIKAIEGLTPGKAYKVSLVAAGPGGTAVPYVTVSTGLVDIYGTSVSTNSRGNKIISSALPQAAYGGTDGVADWRKITVYFTATKATEYLHITFATSQTYVDDLVCKEISDITEWDFENGSMDNVIDDANKSAIGSVGYTSFVSATESDPAKLGNKYLTLTGANHRWANRVNFAFNYDSAYKYVISFDLKVIEYAPYPTGTSGNNQIEMAISKMDDGYYGGTAINPKGANKVTRYFEDGTTYNKVTDFSDQNNCQALYITKASSTGGAELNFDEKYGGAVWDEWCNWQIEIDPYANDYVGPAEFGFQLTGLGWVLGMDNIKITKFAVSDIEAADAATNGTYAYNIRSKNAKGGQGLRFKSTVDLNILDNFGTGAKVVEYGTLATNKLTYESFNNQLLRSLAKDKATDGYVVAGVAYNRESGTNVQYDYDSETNTLTYTGVLMNLSKIQYNTVWVVRGYIIIENADGVQTTVYDDVQFLSLVDAAQYIVDTSDKADDVAAAQEVLDVVK